MVHALEAAQHARSRVHFCGWLRHVSPGLKLGGLVSCKLAER